MQSGRAAPEGYQINALFLTILFYRVRTQILSEPRRIYFNYCPQGWDELIHRNSRIFLKILVGIWRDVRIEEKLRIEIEPTSFAPSIDRETSRTGR